MCHSIDKDTGASRGLNWINSVLPEGHFRCATAQICPTEKCSKPCTYFCLALFVTRSAIHRLRRQDGKKWIRLVKNNLAMGWDIITGSGIFPVMVPSPLPLAFESMGWRGNNWKWFKVCHKDLINRFTNIAMIIFPPSYGSHSQFSSWPFHSWGCKY